MANKKTKIVVGASAAAVALLAVPAVVWTYADKLKPIDKSKLKDLHGEALNFYSSLDKNKHSEIQSYLNEELANVEAILRDSSASEDEVKTAYLKLFETLGQAHHDKIFVEFTDLENEASELKTKLPSPQMLAEKEELEAILKEVEKVRKSSDSQEILAANKKLSDALASINEKYNGYLTSNQNLVNRIQQQAKIGNELLDKDQDTNYILADVKQELQEVIEKVKNAKSEEEKAALEKKLYDITNAVIKADNQYKLNNPNVSDQEFRNSLKELINTSKSLQLLLNKPLDEKLGVQIEAAQAVLDNPNLTKAELIQAQEQLQKLNNTVDILDSSLNELKNNIHLNPSQKEATKNELLSGLKDDKSLDFDAINLATDKAYHLDIKMKNLDDKVKGLTENDNYKYASPEIRTKIDAILNEVNSAYLAIPGGAKVLNEVQEQIDALNTNLAKLDGKDNLNKLALRIKNLPNISNSVKNKLIQLLDEKANSYEEALAFVEDSKKLDKRVGQLQESINAAEALRKDEKYTNASIDAKFKLDAEIEYANEFIESLDIEQKFEFNKLQDDIDVREERLLSAMDTIDPNSIQNAKNTTRNLLEDAKKKLEALKHSKYDSAEKKALKDQVALLEELLNKDEVTREELLAGNKETRSAMDNLDAYAKDRDAEQTKLEALITQALALKNQMPNEMAVDIEALENAINQADEHKLTSKDQLVKENKALTEALLQAQKAKAANDEKRRQEAVKEAQEAAKAALEAARQEIAAATHSSETKNYLINKANELEALINANPADITLVDINNKVTSVKSGTSDLKAYEENANSRDKLNDVLQQVAQFKIATQDKNYDHLTQDERDKLIAKQSAALALLENKSAKTADINKMTEELAKVLADTQFADNVFEAKKVLEKVESKLADVTEEKYTSTQKDALQAQRDELKALIDQNTTIANDPEARKTYLDSLKEKSTQAQGTIVEVDDFVKVRNDREVDLNGELKKAQELSNLLANHLPTLLQTKNNLDQLINSINDDNQKTLDEINSYIEQLANQYTQANETYKEKLANDNQHARDNASAQITSAQNQLDNKANDPKYAGEEKDAVEKAKNDLNTLLGYTNPAATTQQIEEATKKLQNAQKALDDYIKNYDAKGSELERSIFDAKKHLEKMKALTPAPTDVEAFKDQIANYEKLISDTENAKNSPDVEAVNKLLQDLNTASNQAKTDYNNRYNELLNIARANADSELNKTLAFESAKFEGTQYDGPIKDELQRLYDELSDAKLTNDLDKIRELTSALQNQLALAKVHKDKVDANVDITKAQTLLTNTSDPKYAGSEHDTLEAKKLALEQAIANASTSEEVLQAQKELKAAISAMEVKKAQIEANEVLAQAKEKATQVANAEYNSPQKEALNNAIQELEAKIVAGNVNDIKLAQDALKKAMSDMDTQKRKHDKLKADLLSAINEANQFKDAMSEINEDKENFEAKIAAAQAILDATNEDAIDENVNEAILQLQRDLDGAKRDDSRNKSIETHQKNSQYQLDRVTAAIALAEEIKYNGPEKTEAIEAQKALDELMKKVEGIDKDLIIPEINAARKRAEDAAIALENYKGEYDIKNEELKKAVAEAEKTYDSIKDNPAYKTQAEKLLAQINDSKQYIDNPTIIQITNTITKIEKINSEVNEQKNSYENMINSPEYTEAKKLASQTLEEAKALLQDAWVVGNDFDSDEKANLVASLTTYKDRLQAVVDNVNTTTAQFDAAEASCADAIDKLKAYKAKKETELLIEKYSQFTKQAATNSQYFGISQLEDLKTEISKAEVSIQERDAKYAKLENVRSQLAQKGALFDQFVRSDYANLKASAQGFYDSIKTDTKYDSISNELKTTLDNNVYPDSEDLNTKTTSDLMMRSLNIQNAEKDARSKKDAAEVYAHGNVVFTEALAAEYDSAEKTALNDALVELEEKLRGIDITAINLAKEKVSTASTKMDAYITNHNKLKRDLQTDIDDASDFLNRMSLINDDKETLQAAITLAQSKLQTTNPSIEQARADLRVALATARTQDSINKNIESMQSQANMAYYTPAKNWLEQNFADVKYDSEAKTDLNEALSALETLVVNKEGINKETFETDLQEAINKVKESVADNKLTLAKAYKNSYDAKNQALKEEIKIASDLETKMNEIKKIDGIVVDQAFTTALNELNTLISEANALKDTKDVNNGLETKTEELKVKISQAEEKFKAIYQNHYNTVLKPEIATVQTYANDVAYKNMSGAQYDGEYKTAIRNIAAELIGVDLSLNSSINSNTYDVYFLSALAQKTAQTKAQAIKSDHYRANIDSAAPQTEAKNLIAKMTDTIYDSPEKTKLIELSNKLQTLNDLELGSKATAATEIDQLIQELKSQQELAIVVYDLKFAVKRFDENIKKLETDAAYRQSHFFNQDYAKQMRNFYDFLFTPEKVDLMRSTANDTTKSAFQRQLAREMMNVVKFTDENFATWGMFTFDTQTSLEDVKKAQENLDSYLSRFYYLVNAEEEWITGDYTKTLRLRNYLAGYADKGVFKPANASKPTISEISNYEYRPNTSTNSYSQRMNRLNEARYSAEYGFQRYILNLNYDAAHKEGLYDYGWDGNKVTTKYASNDTALRQRSANDMMKFWINEGYIKQISGVYSLFEVCVNYISKPENQNNPKVLKLEKDINIVMKSTGSEFISLQVAQVLFEFIINNNIKPVDNLFSERPAFALVTSNINTTVSN